VEDDVKGRETSFPEDMEGATSGITQFAVWQTFNQCNASNVTLNTVQSRVSVIPMLASCSRASHSRTSGLNEQPWGANKQPWTELSNLEARIGVQTNNLGRSLVTLRRELGCKRTTL
jgi:hypothetical protein